MEIQLKQTDYNRITKKMDSLNSDVLISKIIFKIANRLETQAKINISKLTFKKSTGKLLQSVSIQKINNLKSEVKVGTKYGQYVNFGTGIFIGRKPWVTNFGGVLPHPIWMKGVKPRPFWTTAVKSVKKEVSTIINNEIKKYVS